MGGEQIMNIDLTTHEREQIAEVLRRQANEIAGFKADYTRGNAHLGSVELALTREIARLRHLESRVHPAEHDEGEEP